MKLELKYDEDDSLLLPPWLAKPLLLRTATVEVNIGISVGSFSTSVTKKYRFLAKFEGGELLKLRVTEKVTLTSTWRLSRVSILWKKNTTLEEDWSYQIWMHVLCNDCLSFQMNQSMLCHCKKGKTLIQIFWMTHILRCNTVFVLFNAQVLLNAHPLITEMSVEVFF